MVGQFATILALLSIGSYAWTWSSPDDLASDGLGKCHRVTSVLGVYICLSKKAYEDELAKCDHIASVFAQLLDENEDGVADDASVLNKMTSGSTEGPWAMIVPVDESDDSDLSGMTGVKGQLTMTREATINSCDVPANRGASNTDRSTWAAAVDNTPGSTGCNSDRDATVEECLHLIQEAAAQAYPSKWGTTYSSTAGQAASAANGDCGWGYLGTYQNPGGSSSSCSGQYAYDDDTCTEDCVVVEGLYWASVSYIGGHFTNKRAEETQNEWLMTVPDSSMSGSLPSYSNARTLQDGSAAMYALVSDTTGSQNAWLPSKMPDGNYQGSITNNQDSGASSSDSSDSSDDFGSLIGLFSALLAVVTLQ